MMAGQVGDLAAARSRGYRCPVPGIADAVYPIRPTPGTHRANLNYAIVMQDRVVRGPNLADPEVWSMLRVPYAGHVATTSTGTRA